MVTGVLDEIQVNFVNVSRTLRLLIRIEQKVLNFLVITCNKGNTSKLAHHCQSLRTDIRAKYFVKSSFMKKCTAINAQKATALQKKSGRQRFTQIKSYWFHNGSIFLICLNQWARKSMLKKMVSLFSAFYFSLKNRLLIIQKHILGTSMYK